MFGSKTHTPESFWKWFAKNRKLLSMPGEKFVVLVGKELDKYCEGLVCEVGPDDQRPREFIISADGIRERIAPVESLADRAPDLNDWIITRFRPRLKDFAELGIRFGDVHVKGENMKFITSRNGPTTDLIIFTNWRTDPEATNPDGPTFIMLDMALGEYDVMCRVGAIEVLPLEGAPSSAKPWAELQDAFEESQGGPDER